MGDRSYEHFCRFGIAVDERLQALGASRLMPRVEGNLDVDEPFEQWKSELIARLEQSSAGRVLIVPAVAEATK